MLLGLIQLGEGVAVNVLTKSGLSLESVRSEVENQAGTGTGQNPIGTIPYTPRLTRVIALAQKEARAVNLAQYGTGQLLMGLLIEGGGVAAQVLNGFDFDVEKARHGILKALDGKSDAPTDVQKPLSTTTGSQFSTETEQLLASLKQESERLGHNFIGAEHLLLGWLQLGRGIAFEILQKQGIDFEKLRGEAEKSFPRPVGQLLDHKSYAVDVKKIIAFAGAEARGLNSGQIGPDHVMLGVLGVPDNNAALALKNLNVDIAAFREDIIKGLQAARKRL